MINDDDLEEIFDRYAGLVLLGQDWPPGAAERTSSNLDYAHVAAPKGDRGRRRRAPVEEFSPGLRGEALFRGVVAVPE